MMLAATRRRDALPVVYHSSAVSQSRSFRGRFDRFVDLTGHGPRSRVTSELGTALDDVGGARRFTDILVYNTGSNPSQRNAAD